MRLVDADALIKNLRANKKTVKSGIGGMYTAGMLAGIDFAGVTVTNAPTVEARKHGRWVYDDPFGALPKCSECGCRSRDAAAKECAIPYCPHCGAVMDKEAQK